MDGFEKAAAALFVTYFIVVMGVIVFVCWLAYHIAQHQGWI